MMIAEMGKLKLVMNSGQYTNENGETYTGYGFTAYRTNPLTEVFTIDDLSVDPEEIRELIRLITDNNVSLEHFQDLIEDFCV